MLILELRATAVWAGTEFGLKVLINMIGFVPEGARMSALAPRPFRRQGAFLWFDAERSSLAVRGALSGCEGLFQLGDALCFDFQLFVQRSVFGPQGIEFGRHLSHAFGLRARRLEEAIGILAPPLPQDCGAAIHSQSRSLKSLHSG